MVCFYGISSIFETGLILPVDLDVLLIWLHGPSRGTFNTKLMNSVGAVMFISKPSPNGPKEAMNILVTQPGNPSSSIRCLEHDHPENVCIDGSQTSPNWQRRFKVALQQDMLPSTPLKML